MATKIYTEMVGDLFHYGHVRFLGKARQLGSLLTVGVLSDEWCRLRKRAAVLSQAERIEVIASCVYVDDVIAIDAPNSGAWLVQNGYTFSVHAYANDEDLSRDLATMDPQLRQLMIELPYENGISSTEIIRRIRSRNAL